MSWKKEQLKTLKYKSYTKIEVHLFEKNNVWECEPNNQVNIYKPTEGTNIGT